MGISDETSEAVRTKFVKVDYESLNSRQREVYNFHYVGSVLAKYGYASYPIRDDWNGGDIFARHMINGDAITIQLKSRLTFDRKYCGKDLWMAFPSTGGVYLYPHDALLAKYLAAREARGEPLEKSDAWQRDGLVHWLTPTRELQELLSHYHLT